MLRLTGFIKPAILSAGAAIVIAGLLVSSPLTATSRPAQATKLSGSDGPVALATLLGSEKSMGPRARASVPTFAGLYQREVRARKMQLARASRSGSACADVPAPGYLHTSGKWIEDLNNCHVRLAGATWYGMQTTLYVPAGLNFLPYKTILALIKKYGFNSVRIPISNDVVEKNDSSTVSDKYILANPKLQGLHPLQMLDAIVTTCQKLGLMVILDDHFSHARSPHSYGVSVSRSIRPAARAKSWTGSDYISTQNWINDWLTLTNRYMGNPTVIGFDLRNEPHTDFPGPKGHHWDLKDYLTHGATWGPYASKLWSPATDWAAAATEAGNAILAVNPHLLMFVEGVQLWPDPTQKHGVETYWWGSIFRGVKTDPIVFLVPHQLVYSPHEWGPWKDNLGDFGPHMTFDSLSKVFLKNWAYILHATSPLVQAPIWLGEFNSCNNNKKCVTSTKKGSEGLWFQYLIKYLRKNPSIGWSYYPLNGTNSFDQPSNNSLFGAKWKGPKVGPMMQDLRTIQSQPN